MNGPLVVVGDALLDRDLRGSATRLAPDAPIPVVAEPTEHPRPGGAALAAALASADGMPVTLVTALGDDEAGEQLRTLLRDVNVGVVDLGLRGPTAQKVRVRAANQSIVRLDYGGPAGRPGRMSEEANDALSRARAVLVSDYGRGVTGSASVRQALAAAATKRPLVWDPHPRGAVPVPHARMVTPNREEAWRFTREDLPEDNDGEGLPAVTRRAKILLQRWSAASVAITLGARGALLVGGDGTPLAVPARRVGAGDPCGAGDRFATRAAGLLSGGALPSEAVSEAVAAASAFVAAGGASTWPHRPAPPRPVGADAGAPGAHPSRRAAQRVAEAVRAYGGTVVATGGCFDLLHAGHVRMLSAARALGDCLIVCLNSDDSVRRLKGPDRPLVPAADRAAVLAGLACVDAVALFTEDTPEQILEELRPDVWTKGADYAVEDLPEARLLERWGGQAVVLPYLPGRSTTTMLQQALSRAQPEEVSHS